MCWLAHEQMGLRWFKSYATPYVPSLTELTNQFLTVRFPHQQGAICCNTYFLLFVFNVVHASVEALLLLIVCGRHKNFVGQYPTQPSHPPGGVKFVD